MSLSTSSGPKRALTRHLAEAAPAEEPEAPDRRSRPLASRFLRSGGFPPTNFTDTDISFHCRWVRSHFRPPPRNINIAWPLLGSIRPLRARGSGTDQFPRLRAP